MLGIKYFDKSDKENIQQEKEYNEAALYKAIHMLGKVTSVISSAGNIYKGLKKTYKTSRITATTVRKYDYKKGASLTAYIMKQAAFKVANFYGTVSMKSISYKNDTVTKNSISVNNIDFSQNAFSKHIILSTSSAVSQADIGVYQKTGGITFMQ